MSQRHSAIRALEPFTEPGTPSLELYEYMVGDRELGDLDIDTYLTGMRRARVLVARHQHRTRTEWVFPAMQGTTDSNPLIGCTEPWVLVFESTDEDTWHHQNRIHESSVISRGIPEPEDILHVSNIDSVVPAIALANKASFVGGAGNE